MQVFDEIFDDWELPVNGGWYVSAISPIAHRFHYIDATSEQLVSYCGLKRRSMKVLRPAAPNTLPCKICQVKQ
jgi:hypothetical protein